MCNIHCTWVLMSSWYLGFDEVVVSWVLVLMVKIPLLSQYLVMFEAPMVCNKHNVQHPLDLCVSLSSFSERVETMMVLPVRLVFSCFFKLGQLDQPVLELVVSQFLASRLQDKMEAPDWMTVATDWVALIPPESIMMIQAIDSVYVGKCDMDVVTMNNLLDMLGLPQIMVVPPTGLVPPTQPLGVWAIVIAKS